MTLGQAGLDLKGDCQKGGAAEVTVVLKGFASPKLTFASHGPSTHFRAGRGHQVASDCSPLLTLTLMLYARGSVSWPCVTQDTALHLLTPSCVPSG